MRALVEDREKRLREVAKAGIALDDPVVKADEDIFGSSDDGRAKKRRTSEVAAATDLPAGRHYRISRIGDELEKPSSTIFGPIATSPGMTLRHAGTQNLGSLIRPALATPSRPQSPRRVEKKRGGMYVGMGEYSPRGRGGTYTPPRILPSGDETAPLRATGSPAPSLCKFDFVSPLGPVKLGKLSNGDALVPVLRKASLESVREDPDEDDGKGWTVVGKRGRRAGSMPCRDKTEGFGIDVVRGMEVET